MSRALHCLLHQGIMLTCARFCPITTKKPVHTRFLSINLGRHVPPEAKREYINNVAYYWNNYEQLTKAYEQCTLKRVLVIDNNKVVGSFDTVPAAHIFMGENSETVSSRAYVTCIGDEDAPSRVLLTPASNTKMFCTTKGSDYKPEGPLTNGRGPYRAPFGAYIYGPDLRPYIVMSIKTKNMTDYIYVDFCIDTGSPVTTITRDVYLALGLTEEPTWPLFVDTKKVSVQPSSYHYENMCLLGASFLSDKKLTIDYVNEKIDLNS